MTGKAEPIAMHERINAKGNPEAYLFKIGPQMIGEKHILRPRIIHINVIKLAPVSYTHLTLPTKA